MKFHQHLPVQAKKEAWKLAKVARSQQALGKWLQFQCSHGWSVPQHRVAQDGILP
jgi:hypothetical protein